MSKKVHEVSNGIDGGRYVETTGGGDTEVETGVGKNSKVRYTNYADPNEGPNSELRQTSNATNQPRSADGTFAEKALVGEQTIYKPHGKGKGSYEMNAFLEQLQDLKIFDKMFDSPFAKVCKNTRDFSRFFNDIAHKRGISKKDRDNNPELNDELNQLGRDASTKRFGIDYSHSPDKKLIEKAFKALKDSGILREEREREAGVYRNADGTPGKSVVSDYNAYWDPNNSDYKEKYRPGQEVVIPEGSALVVAGAFLAAAGCSMGDVEPMLKRRALVDYEKGMMKSLGRDMKVTETFIPFFDENMAKKRKRVFTKNLKKIMQDMKSPGMMKVAENRDLNARFKNETELNDYLARANNPRGVNVPTHKNARGTVDYKARKNQKAPDMALRKIYVSREANQKIFNDVLKTGTFSPRNLFAINELIREENKKRLNKAIRRKGKTSTYDTEGNFVHKGTFSRVNPKAKKTKLRTNKSVNIKAGESYQIPKNSRFSRFKKQ